MIDAPAPVRFNLRDRVRDVAEECSDPRPAYIAVRVIDSLTSDQRNEALRITLPDYVRSIVSLRVDEASRTDTAITTRTTLTRAERTAQFNRDKMLRKSVFNGDQWKFFRDFTAIDVHGAAFQRYKSATENQVVGDRLETLAQLMEKNKYATVADVPATELRDVFGGSSL